MTYTSSILYADRTSLSPSPISLQDGQKNLITTTENVFNFGEQQIPTEVDTVAKVIQYVQDILKYSNTELDRYLQVSDVNTSKNVRELKQEVIESILNFMEYDLDRWFTLKKDNNKYNENEARQIIRALSIKDDYEQVQLLETKNVNWLTDNVLDDNQGNDGILTKLKRDYLRKHLVYAYDNSSPPILGEAYLELAPSQTEAKAANSAIFNSVASQYIDKLIDLLDDDQVNSFKNARLGTGLNFPPDVFQDNDTILEKREKLKTKIKNAGPISERIRGQIWFGVGQSYEEKRSKASYIKELNAILEGSVRTIFGLQFGDINYDLYLHQTTPIENLVKQYIYILIFSK